MALVIRHKFVSAIPDGGDVTIVQPSNWNDDHSLSGSLPISFVDGLQAALDDKVGSNSLSVALAATLTSNSASVMIVAALATYVTSDSLSIGLATKLTSNSASAMIVTALAPYLTSASAALSTYLTSNSFSAAISVYATSNSTSIMIAAALVSYTVSNSVSIMIAAALVPYAASNSVSAMIVAALGAYTTSNSVSAALAAKQPNFNVQDEGVSLTLSAGNVTQINFTGPGISASLAGGVLTVTAPFGAGGVSATLTVSIFQTDTLTVLGTLSVSGAAVFAGTVAVSATLSAGSIRTVNGAVIGGGIAVSATVSAAAVTILGRPVGCVLLGYQTFGGINSVAFSGSWSDIGLLEMHITHRMEAGGTSQTASVALSTDGGATAHLNLQIGATQSASAPQAVILRAYGGNGRPRKQIFTQQIRGSVISNFLAGTATANAGFVNWIRYATSSSMTDGTAMLWGWKVS